MASRIFAFCGLLGFILFISSCGCKEDEFGEQMIIELPVSTYPNKDTFQLGDTLWVECLFPKVFSVKDASGEIVLEDFQFRTSLFFSEVSDTIEQYGNEVGVLERIGTVDFLPSFTAAEYPIGIVEDSLNYYFKAGFVLLEPGLYWFGFSTPEFLYEDYEHPAMYTCGRNRRSSVNFFHQNPATSEEGYQRLISETNVEYIPELTELEEYKGGGCLTFRVLE
ncbi:MAG: hypothetical protein RIC19_20515 [Phaeodactylibacter sp.]|uniref:hypothetical protein n=1 Tax=Phaeodactylibacter sp. TaxID=1940289 RepID=UPI0032EE9D79